MLVARRGALSPQAYSPFFTSVRKVYGTRKLVWVLNRNGKKLQVDTRDAGKKYRRISDSFITVMDGRKGKRGGVNSGQGKLRGRKTDKHEVQLSKTISWLLRHGAKSEGLDMRPDGYVRVTDLLRTRKLADSLDFPALQEIVSSDSKQRYTLLHEPDVTPGSDETIWWIRANQGHSIKAVKLELQPITSANEIPMAVHGTTKRAWESIETQGLSRMNRNHIHLAQGVTTDNVISGMRKSSAILIFIDVQKALDAGLTFELSSNGVVLTAGDEQGYLAPEFFKRVEDFRRIPLPGWENTPDVRREAAESGISERHVDDTNTKASVKTFTSEDAVVEKMDKVELV